MPDANHTGNPSAGKPVIFSAPMVLALLAGRKTQTRRTIKPQPDIAADARIRAVLCEGTVYSGGVKLKYAPGDQLYVREGFMPRLGGLAVPHYRADNDRPEWRRLWRSPIHMPRRISRLTLTVTDVRVQRLQEISAADCRAEGYPVDWSRSTDPEVHGDAARGWFMDLWGAIHGPDAWAANPYVAVYSFTVEQRNIDQ